LSSAYHDLVFEVYYILPYSLSSFVYLSPILQREGTKLQKRAEAGDPFLSMSEKIKIDLSIQLGLI
jgi:hypothetical protein